MENISSALLDWFYKNHRILPFRTDPSPYHVWLSEIMLQQTRVSAALPYYERFLAALPDIPALAACEEEKLHKLWEGLGYYSRVRNLQKAAGRPGLNPLRFSEKYTITEKHAQDLAKIAEVTGINGLRDLHRQEGFIAPLSEGVMEFGGKMFEISKDGTEGRSSSPNPIDVKRTVDAIREAKMTCEAVLVMVHSHEIRKDNDEEADYFLEEFAHACIDAGASAVIGGGTHQLKGIELYHDCPIFYCLGNFIFENQYVRLLPADYMEKYGLNIHTAASIGIARRQEQSSHSLYEIPEVYRSVLPYFEICQGKCTHLELLPVELGMDRENAEKNIPYVADEKTAEKIAEYLTRVSKRYGTEWEYKEGRIVLHA